MTDQDRKDFLCALPISFTAGEESITVRPKQFSSGSVGWHGQGKMTLHDVRCQVNIICTVVGSKPETGTPSPEANKNGLPGGPPKAPKGKKAPSAIEGAQKAPRDA